MDKTSAGLNLVLMHLNQSGLQISKLTINNDDEEERLSDRHLTIRIQLKLKKIKTMRYLSQR